VGVKNSYYGRTDQKFLINTTNFKEKIRNPQWKGWTDNLKDNIACITRIPFPLPENTKLYSLQSLMDDYSNLRSKPLNFVIQSDKKVV